MPLPTVAFMHPTLVPRPIHHEGWVYEEKYDGWRMLAYTCSRARTGSLDGG